MLEDVAFFNFHSSRSPIYDNGSNILSPPSEVNHDSMKALNIENPSSVSLEKVHVEEAGDALVHRVTPKSTKVQDNSEMFSKSSLHGVHHGISRNKKTQEVIRSIMSRHTDKNKC